MVKPILPFCFPVACTLLMLSQNFASATENGQQRYPIGINTVLNGIMPEPGKTQFYNYSLYYSADKLADKNGNEALPKFSADVVVDAMRVVHTWDVDAGPFQLASGLVVPLIYNKVELPFGRDSTSGVGDIVLHGLYLGYRNIDANFYSFLALDFTLPTGRYSDERIANVGANTYGFAPSLNATWFPNPKTELSATVGYEINSPNHDTNYHSGNIAFAEWIVGYSFLPNLQLGVQGYALQQVTDDTSSSVDIDDGYRGKAFAIGPQVRYNFTPNSGIAVKWQHEFGVRNRPEGDRLWVQFSFPL